MQLISKQITHPYICSGLGYLAWQLSRAMLFQWGLVNQKCPVRQLSATTSSVWRTLLGSFNGLSPGCRQAIIRTTAGILLIEPLGTNFNEILFKIHTFSFKKAALLSQLQWVKGSGWFHNCFGDATHYVFQMTPKFNVLSKPSCAALDIFVCWPYFTSQTAVILP